MTDKDDQLGGILYKMAKLQEQMRLLTLQVERLEKEAFHRLVAKELKKK